MTEPDDQASLAAYGTHDDLTPPRFQKESVLMPARSSRAAGWIGPIPNRDIYGFATIIEPAEREPPRYHEQPEGFALEESLRRRLTRHGVGRVLVVDEQTGTVFEWTLGAFDRSVPKAALGDSERGHIAAAIDHALHWPKHADSVWIDPDVDVTHGYRKIDY